MGNPFPNRIGAALGLCILLSACMDSYATRDGDVPAQNPIGPLDTVPVVDAATGTCFSRATTPAVIETVTEQVLVQPAVVRSDGTVQSPAAFRTVTRQQILRERREVEFETPCAAIMTPEFIASVQRALDTRTGRAIERFQTDQGDVHTTTLTLRSARTLGLVALPRDQL